jgi:hypothetical protein
MQKQSLQNLVSNLFHDSSTRSQFESNPESVLGQYNLSDSEKNVLLSPVMKTALVTGDNKTMQSEMGLLDTWI